MKLAISNYGLKEKYTAEQVAYTLDDVIDAVENGRKTVGKPKEKDNQFIRQKRAKS